MRAWSSGDGAGTCPSPTTTEDGRAVARIGEEGGAEPGGPVGGAAAPGAPTRVIGGVVPGAVEPACRWMTDVGVASSGSVRKLRRLSNRNVRSDSGQTSASFGTSVSKNGIS